MGIDKYRLLTRFSIWHTVNGLVLPQRFSLAIPNSLVSSLLTILPPFDLVVVDKIAASVAFGSPLDEAIYTALMATTMLRLIMVSLIEFIELMARQLLTPRLGM
jgi:hypothetical protein